MLKIKSLLGLTVILLLSGACAPLAGEQPTPTLIPDTVLLEKPTFEVSEGDVTKTIQLTGRVTPVTQENLFYRIDGTVKEVLVQIGDQVEAGEVLARLDEPERYLVEIASAEYAAATTLKDLETIRISSPAKLIEAEKALERAIRNLETAMQGVSTLTYYLENPPNFNGKAGTDLLNERDVAQQTYEEASKAYDLGVIDQANSAKMVELLKTMQSAYQTYLSAQNRLDWVQNRSSQAEKKLVLARADYESALQEVKRWTISDSTSDYAIANLKYQDALARLNLAKLAQESNEIKATNSGQVISLGITSGSQVKAFQVVATVANMDKLEITAIPKAEELNLLGIGQTATVRMNDITGKTFTAVIAGIPVKMTSQMPLDQAVMFKLEPGAAELEPGATATIMVTIETRKKALWLPPAAIRTYQGQSYVLIQDGDIVRRVNVVLGLTTSDRVEILSGLEKGQKVLGQ